MLRRNKTLCEPRAGRRMEAEDAKAAATAGSKKPPSLPPALYLMRARSRTSKVLDLDSASSGPPTPPLRPPVTVPFLWEEAPGKPKVKEAEAGASPAATGTVLAERAEARPVPLKLPPRLQATAATAAPLLADGAELRPVPLKLPPRLQVAATAEHSLSSPNTVLQGPNGGKRPRRTLRRSGSTASFRRRPGAGGGLFSWRKATVAAGNKKDVHDGQDAAPPESSCCSPAASSASSSSSSSLSYFGGDDHGGGADRRQADGGEEDDDEGVKRAVRITRLRRNRSLPSMTASHLWASIRKSVKQITPWS